MNLYCKQLLKINEYNQSSKYYNQYQDIFLQKSQEKTEQEFFCDILTKKGVLKMVFDGVSFENNIKVTILTTKFSYPCNYQKMHTQILSLQTKYFRQFLKFFCYFGTKLFKNFNSKFIFKKFAQDYHYLIYFDETKWKAQQNRQNQKF
eukprot:TRINITY_DN37095_c0_g1_i1.p3 TRINITY_DN37095_c0_g1~~TRINITY_DN37095_c0_g1_i1.p3  ORF type:complete len:148 (-),score=9.29 TRINITY_DN37095_c0_g1_i1:401-844(-)